MNVFIAEIIFFQKRQAFSHSSRPVQTCNGIINSPDVIPDTKVRMWQDQTDVERIILLIETFGMYVKRARNSAEQFQRK